MVGLGRGMFLGGEVSTCGMPKQLRLHSSDFEELAEYGEKLGDKLGIELQ